MAAPATPAEAATAGEAADAGGGCLRYLKGCPEAFVSLADVCLVVEGTELPCHSQYLARHCKFFGELFAALTETATAATPPFSAAAPLRLEEPFRGMRAVHVELFLSCLYRPAEAGSLGRSPAGLVAFEAVYDLANRFDCGPLLDELNQHVTHWFFSSVLKQDLMGWIAFADRWAGPLLHSPLPVAGGRLHRAW